MNSADLEFLSDFLNRRSGLVLGPSKMAMVRNKLGPVAHRFGFKKVEALLSELHHEPEELSRAVTEAMTVNESSFFRDRACFDHFKGTILPSLMNARGATRRLRIWSAASSSGQEPYSIAMILDEMKLVQAGWKIDLIATDLNSEMVARARDGLYLDYEVTRGLTTQHLVKYFTQEGNQWRMSERLRRMVNFRPFNLLDSFGWLGQIDVVFCRNVLLYFDAQEKFYALERLSRVVAPDGYLLLGATEESNNDAFVPAAKARSIFVKTNAARAALLAG